MYYLSQKIRTKGIVVSEQEVKKILLGGGDEDKVVT